MIKLELDYLRKGLPVVVKLNLPDNSTIKTLRKNSVLRSVYSYAVAAGNSEVNLTLQGKHAQKVNVAQHFDKYINDLVDLCIPAKLQDTSLETTLKAPSKPKTFTKPHYAANKNEAVAEKASSSAAKSSRNKPATIMVKRRKTPVEKVEGGEVVGGFFFPEDK